MYIVGEDGRIEMQGCPRVNKVVMAFGERKPAGMTRDATWVRRLSPNSTPSHMLEGPDSQGRYFYKMTEGELPPKYLSLINGVPHLHILREGSSAYRVEKLHPAYTVREWVTKPGASKLLAEGTKEPLTMLIDLQGQIISGRPFHVLSKANQKERLIDLSQMPTDKPSGS